MRAYIIKKINLSKINKNPVTTKRAQMQTLEISEEL